MPHVPKSERKCEGMNPHTPKGVPTLGVRVPVDSQMFKKQLQGSKPIGQNTSYSQKNGEESNWQFDSQPLKVENRPNLLVCRWRVT
jgi:hypothetical protein